MLWVIVIMVVVLFNIPFGYWRKNVTRLSRQWFMSIHIPVPVVIILRIWLDLEWKWTTFPVFFGAYICGQFLGAKWHRIWKKSMCVSSCLFRDIVRRRIIPRNRM